MEFLSCFSSDFISVKNKFGLLYETLMALTCILSQESSSEHFWLKAAVEGLNKKNDHQMSLVRAGTPLYPQLGPKEDFLSYEGGVKNLILNFKKIKYNFGSWW